MTESSILWENNGTGDGTSSGYSQAKLVEWMRALFTKSANRGGVSPDYLNELAVSGASSPVAVASGAAVCYGFVYFSDTSVNVNIPTPSGATRIDRVVLRVDWSAQTVRITRVAGSEGSGTPPALTQSVGTTWDVPLAQVSITTGGVITVTDEREWLSVLGDEDVSAAKLATDAVVTTKIQDDAVTTAKIDNGAVTTAKLDTASVTAAKLASDAVETDKLDDAAVTTSKLADNAVDDTKVGNRVPQFLRRQGGSATSWAATGTTTYTPGAVIMQAGSVMSTASSVASGSVNVILPVTPSDHLLIFVSPITASGEFITCTVAQVVPGSFSIYWETTDGSLIYNPTFSWLAIGPG